MKNISPKDIYIYIYIYIYPFTQNIASDMRDALSHARWIERQEEESSVSGANTRRARSEISFCPISVLRGGARDKGAASGLQRKPNGNFWALESIDEREREREREREKDQPSSLSIPLGECRRLAGVHRYARRLPTESSGAGRVRACPRGRDVRDTRCRYIAGYGQNRNVNSACVNEGNGARTVAVVVGREIGGEIAPPGEEGECAEKVRVVYVRGSTLLPEFKADFSANVACAG
jgi:hypothetical protein